MKLFDSKFMNRLALWKAIGFTVWLFAFFMIPIVFTDTDLMIRLAVMFWYTTLWAIIWVFWVLDKYPILNLKIPYWFRWAWIWAWMNFILTLFIFNKLTLLMQWSLLEWYSPFWLILEWALIWFIIDCITTKTIWDGKDLIK